LNFKNYDNKDRINFLRARGKEIIQEIIKRRDIDINHAQTVRDMYQDERDATKKECDTLKISNKFLDESYQKCLNDRQELVRRFEEQKKVLEELQEKCKNFQEICAALQKQIRPYLESNNELKNRVTRLEEELVRETARKDHWKNRCDARDLNIRNLQEQIRLNGLQIQVGQARYTRLMRRVYALRIQMQWFRFRQMNLPINPPQPQIVWLPLL